MITIKTVERIWRAHREIAAAQKILSDMQEIRERDHENNLRDRRDVHAPTLKDAFGERRHLELGVPSGQKRP